jgi:hypothetical protein
MPTVDKSMPEHTQETTSDEALEIDPRIAAEQFGDEVVLIDIEKGLYFSLRGAAVLLWQAFAEPRSRRDVVRAFEAGDEHLLEQAVAQMSEHGLLRQASRVTAQALGPFPYNPPVVEVFSDLAELIAIDPVHEVDSQYGWPVRIEPSDPAG